MQTHLACGAAVVLHARDLWRTPDGRVKLIDIAARALDPADIVCTAPRAAHQVIFWSWSQSSSAMA
jgi:hypothetical protein